MWCSPLLAAGNATPRSSGGYLIDVWENDDGLPQNSVISMTQTRDGYLWLGTVKGLARFDGTRFVVFNEDNTPELGSSSIVKLFEDSQGTLWIGTELEGVVTARAGQTIRLGIGRGSREGRLASICEDAVGVVWLCTSDGQLWRYQNGTTNMFRAPGRSGGYRSVVADASGRVWIGMQGQLIAINSRSDFSRGELPIERRVAAADGLEFLLASPGGGFWCFAGGAIEKWTADGARRVFSPYPGINASVKSACEDREGNLIVGTEGQGVFRFDASGAATPISTNDGLSSSLVLSLQVDRENTLWVGTDGGGLNRLKRRICHVVEETRGRSVRSVCADAQDGVWMSFIALGFSANGAAHLSESGFRGYGRVEGLFISEVWSVFVDREQRVWAGTYGSLFQLQQERFTGVTQLNEIPPGIRAMHQDRQGRLWLGTQGGLVHWVGPSSKPLTTRHGLSADDVWALAEDGEGNLWIGTRGGGLNRLRDGQFTAFHKADGLPSEDISSLYADADGVLWIGTFGSGLVRLHGGKWTRYTARDGLTGNSIGYLLEDGEGYLWIGSNYGLMRIRKQSLNDLAAGLPSSVSVRAFHKPDGLPTGECAQGSQPGACRTRDGRLWFPTIKGLAYVDPSHIVPNTNPPPVIIESVLADGVVRSELGLRVRPPEHIVMSPEEERLEIRYTSLNLSAPDRARFRYRLEGHETAWAEVGNIRVASYSRLPPGDYRFQVMASNEDGVWNESGATLALVVEPHYWQTWWFLGLIGATVIGLVAGAVYYVSTQKLQRQLAGLRQQEAIEQERARIARDIHDQLGANLTQVSLLGELVESDKNQPEEVAAHAKQISQTALETSRALDEIVWTVNPRNDTLDGLVNYICKYAQEYLSVAGLRCRLDIPAALPNSPISPEVRHNVFLACKEAITNITRHAQASSASLRLKLDPDRFTLEIQDDGRGPAGAKEARAQTRNGLRNMGKRMEDVGGSFEIGPAPDRGTLVRLTAPLAKH